MPQPTTTLGLIDVGLRTLLFTKFSDILSLESVNKGVLFYSKETALRELAEKKNKTKLEFINIWRTDVALDWKRMSTPAARRGVDVNYTDEGQRTVYTNIKAIPVALTFDVWFWTHDRDKLNSIIETYLFWQQDDPNLYMQYREIYPLSYDLHFNRIIDESTVDQQFEKGRMYIQKTSISLDGMVFTVPSEEGVITSIHISCYDKDDLETVNYEEIIVVDSNTNIDLQASLHLFTRIVS